MVGTAGAAIGRGVSVWDNVRLLFLLYRRLRL